MTKETTIPEKGKTELVALGGITSVSVFADEEGIVSIPEKREAELVILGDIASDSVIADEEGIVSIPEKREAELVVLGDIISISVIADEEGIASIPEWRKELVALGDITSVSVTPNDDEIVSALLVTGTIKPFVWKELELVSEESPILSVVGPVAVEASTAVGDGWRTEVSRPFESNEDETGEEDSILFEFLSAEVTGA